MEIKNAKLLKQRNDYYLSVEVNGVRKNIKNYGHTIPTASAAEDDYLMYVQGFADASKELGSLMSRIQFMAGVDVNAVNLSFAKPVSHADALKATATGTTTKTKKNTESPVGESGRSLFAFKKGRN